MTVEIFTQTSAIIYHTGTPAPPGAVSLPAIAINTTSNQVSHRWDLATQKWIALFPTVAPAPPAAVARMLATAQNNPSQATLQGLYDGAASAFSAPDTVPADVIALANARSTDNFKVYLGHTKWYYTNAIVGGPGDWQLFGSGGKSAFTASIDSVFTFR